MSVQKNSAPIFASVVDTLRWPATPNDNRYRSTLAAQPLHPESRFYLLNPSTSSQILTGVRSLVGDVVSCDDGLCLVGGAAQGGSAGQEQGRNRSV
ncbi:unnamed protein product [Phytophthora fragariaefolia]|uniref:Unnamed protein product n=1 Tax=Phytophthora fragariaefolia TaxID=1490495 RepID=A0A9W7CXY1_9STRA|nr:unnamed protein product [Phytophthora fragariaefolia]